MALDEQGGDGTLTGGDAVERGFVDCLGVHGGGQPPEPVEDRRQVADDGGVADLQGEGAVLARGDEGHGPVEDEESFGDLVQGAGLDVAV